jgi:hypothetical protein
MIDELNSRKLQLECCRIEKQIEQDHEYHELRMRNENRMNDLKVELVHMQKERIQLQLIQLNQQVGEEDREEEDCNDSDQQLIVNATF